MVQEVWTADRKRIHPGCWEPAVAKKTGVSTIGWQTCWRPSWPLMSSPSRLCSLWTCQLLHLPETTCHVPWKSCKVRLKISCTRMHIIRRPDVSHRQNPSTTSWLFSLGQPVGMRGECRNLQSVFNYVPYGESPGQAHLVLHSQAAVRAHSEARAMLQWDDPLDRRKGSWQSKNMETFIPLQNKITRGLIVDKGNSAQSTDQLFYLCPITQK